ncbi:predicted protein [Sclerotinia sclerotiorum 1980 UF-70]|uniref:Uncharacterized protein n=1 Tax=Sclerotinia sclerotiorum (strain ATCC 18683 / 1980 / Ss-1) TaxID=665079 RepID=A7EJR9_SCLS1|nr:predicted protein [Sclerotinia sclerotiorum 1980 UF-70]EDO03085.1 predicted protein [Sclerotinia sclerotiorum 1980 UF-70]
MILTTITPSIVQEQVPVSASLTLSPHRSPAKLPDAIPSGLDILLAKNNPTLQILETVLPTHNSNYKKPDPVQSPHSVLPAAAVERLNVLIYLDIAPAPAPAPTHVISKRHSNDIYLIL